MDWQAGLQMPAILYRYQIRKRYFISGKQFSFFAGDVMQDYTYEYAMKAIMCVQKTDTTWFMSLLTNFFQIQ